jgi:hypothetical protein
MPGKIANPDNDIDAWLGQELTTALVQGVYGPTDNHRESIPIGRLSTVFQAEVMAILRCT